MSGLATPTPAVGAVRRRFRAGAGRRRPTSWPLVAVFVLPSVLIYLLFMVWPFVGTLQLSLQAWDGHSQLSLAIVAGLVLGKPLGIVAACGLAVWTGAAIKPREYSWRQLGGAGALAGIGFTMSLFIAGQAFPVPADFAAAKIAVFAASVLAALIGVGVLWSAPTPEQAPTQPEGKGSRVE